MYSSVDCPLARGFDLPCILIGTHSHDIEFPPEQRVMHDKPSKISTVLYRLRLIAITRSLMLQVMSSHSGVVHHAHRPVT